VFVLLIRDDLMPSTCQQYPGLNKSVTIRCSLSGTLAATQVLFQELVTVLKL